MIKDNKMEEGFKNYERVNFSEEETKRKASELREYVEKRRSLRFFSTKKVDEQIIADIIMTAS